MTFIETFKKVYEGDKFMHVKITSIDPQTKKKSATEVKQPINFERHLAEEEISGISPVDLDKKACQWLGWDIDDGEVKLEDICRSCFVLDPTLFPFQSTNKRYHIYKYLDKWVPVEEAYTIRTEYIKKFKNLGWVIDENKCLPNSWNFATGRPGAVLFLPTYKDHKVCYSPKGSPLTKEQWQLRVKYKNHPLLVGAIGLTSGQVDGGRAKALFFLGLYLRYVKIPGLRLDDINEKFFSKPEDQKEVDHVINDSLAKDKYSGKEGLKHLIHNYSKYTEALTNVKLPLPKALMELEDADEILESFVDVEPEDEKLMFFRNVIYIKEDDRYWDLRTHRKYKENAIDVDYGKLWKKNTPSYHFARTPIRQVVETRVYRPDKYKKDKPIFKDDEGQLHLNSYRPGGVEPVDPQTNMETKQMLQYFIDLVEYIYPDENERNWVLDFYSTLFQHPGRKIRSSILTYSKYQQIGKSSLFKTIQKGLGEDNCSIISPKQAIDRSKAFLIDKQLVLIDELRIDGTKNYKGLIMDILKPLMTEEQHDARPLFQDWRTIHTITSFAIFTNHEDAIYTDYELEARHSVFEHLKQRLPNDFYEDYWKALKDGQLANVVKHFLLHRKIKTYDDLTKEEKGDEGEPLIPLFNAEGPCLKTEALQRMSAKGDTLTEEIRTLIQQRLEPFHQDIIGINESFLFLKNQGKEITRQNELAEALDKLECKRIGECKHIISNKSPILYSVRNHNAYKKFTNTDVASNYWTPMDWKEWGMTQKDVDIVKGKVKDLFEDPQWIKDQKKEWEEKSKKKEAELDLEEAPY